MNRCACKNKCRHKSREFANIAIRSLEKETGLISYAYHCKCGYWHIGKPSFTQNPILFLKNMNILIDRQNEKLHIIKG